MAKLIALGKCGKKMVWRNNSDSTKWLQKKSYICMLLIILTGMWASQYGMHILKVVERIHKEHRPHPGPQPHRPELDDEFQWPPAEP
jgi:hypothetical protein